MKMLPFNYAIQQEESIYEPYTKFVWKNGDGEKFAASLSTMEMQLQLEKLLEYKGKLDSESIDMATKELSETLIKTADIAGIKSVKGNVKMKTKIKKSENKPWFNGPCKQLKNNILRYAKLLHKQPYNPALLYEFRRVKKCYKTYLRKCKNEYNNKMWEHLSNLNNSNPKAFWDCYSKFQNLEKIHKDNPIPGHVWINHFKSLLNQPLKVDEALNTSIDKYLASNMDKEFNELNFKISEHEILSEIKRLKNKKSSGIDGILNEMLKCSQLYILKHLHNIFNAILLSGHYPTCWRTNTLTPLLKKSSIANPLNYRGIAIGCGLSKLFMKILQNRLSNFCDKNKTIPMCQIGFRKGCRTADHILTLKNIIDKYIYANTRKYLYVCFVDYKSAYDTIWRKALFYKLLQNGIGGNFLKIIQSMYSDVYYCVKLQGRLTQTFTSCNGVKQGCVLSPLLFNIFLSDFPSIFNDENCHPVTVNSNKLNCLMFADDLILISETAIGLQTCLNKLKQYTNKWNLTVNG